MATPLFSKQAMPIEAPIDPPDRGKAVDKASGHGDISIENERTKRNTPSWILAHNSFDIDSNNHNATLGNKDKECR